jgi:hypothetical protein
MIKFILPFFIFSSFSFASVAKVDADKEMLDSYLNIQKEFAAQTCNPKVAETYYELDQKYRGDGNFIPITLDEKIDLKTIKTSLPIFIEKEKWIESQIELLGKIESFEIIAQNLERLENEVKLLQEAKRDHFFAKDKEDKTKIRDKAEKQYQQMLKEVELLKDNAPFLISFKFPLNHLSLRAEYEKQKAIATKDARVKANSIYLYRRIVQDGSYDESLTRNDAVIRSAFDTLYHSLKSEAGRDFLSENERSDFKFVITNFKLLLGMKKEALKERFVAWLDRTKRAHAFYEGLQNKKNDPASIIAEKANALNNLRDFVLKKEAEAYAFWSKQPESIQSLYALETILYAEVGRMDAPDALERKDVAQIVINRSENSKYNNLDDKDSLVPYLSKELKTREFKWLNVLFKEGEFSFTYFYIPGNFHIYCPDVSKVGQYLRRENVRIAQEYFKKPRTGFDALRYFSRMSMFGRIEMDSLWDNYKPMPEVPGRPVTNPKKLSKLFKQDRYRYLYHFNTSDDKKTYLVVEMLGKNYVVDSHNPNALFYHRNPHSFRYFAPAK